MLAIQNGGSGDVMTNVYLWQLKYEKRPTLKWTDLCKCVSSYEINDNGNLVAPDTGGMELL